MRPEILHIPTPFGALPIHSYGLMIVTGFLLALWVGRRECQRRGLPDHFSDMSITLLLCGIVGGRVFYYVQFYDEQFAGQSFLEIFKIWKGGLVFYGAAVGGLVGALGFLLWKRLSIVDHMDVVGLVAPIGMGFGRLGCFLNGCCFGRRCAEDYPLGVVFPASSPAAAHHADLQYIDGGADPLPVHPVQLYQSAHDFLLFFLMLFFYRTASPPRGAGMPLLMVLYGVGRFGLEGLRGDHEPTFTGLTPSQNIAALLAVVFGVALVVIYWRDRRGNPVRP